MSRKAGVFGADTYLAWLLNEQGIDTVTELARRCAMDFASINQAVNGNSRAIFGEEPGTYRKAPIRIAKVLQVIPEVIFGEDPEIERRRVDAEEFFMQLHMSDEPLNPDEILLQGELSEAIHMTLMRLPPVIERNLRMRFGIGISEYYTEPELAEKLALPLERVRMNIARGLRQMKKTKDLAHFL